MCTTLKRIKHFFSYMITYIAIFLNIKRWKFIIFTENWVLPRTISVIVSAKFVVPFYCLKIRRNTVKNTSPECRYRWKWKLFNKMLVSKFMTNLVSFKQPHSTLFFLQGDLRNTKLGKVSALTTVNNKASFN